MVSGALCDPDDPDRSSPRYPIGHPEPIQRRGDATRPTSRYDDALNYVPADLVLLLLACDATEGVYAGAWPVDPVPAPEVEQCRQVL